jgi:polyphosphate kinase
MPTNELVERPTRMRSQYVVSHYLPCLSISTTNQGKYRAAPVAVVQRSKVLNVYDASGHGIYIKVLVRTACEIVPANMNGKAASAIKKVSSRDP